MHTSCNDSDRESGAAVRPGAETSAMGTITTGSLIDKGIAAGATVGVYDGASIPPGADGPPKAAVIASAASAADGTFTITDAGILVGKSYVLAVAGAARYVRARSTLDKSDTGKGAGTGTTA